MKSSNLERKLPSTMILTFFYLLFSAFVICQPIPPSDPAYFYHYQEFRKSPNLDVFIAPYPLMVNALPVSRFQIDKKNTVFRIAPNLRLSNHKPDFRVGAWLAGEWSNISLLAEPVIINKYYAAETIGRAYARGNISGRFSNAFIRYKMENSIIQLGRAPVWWGQSFSSSIIQSGSAQPYDHLAFKLNFSNFQFDLLAGQLTSDTTAVGERVKRFISGHQLKWLPSHKRWFLAIGEQIIYTGVKRSFEFHYLNPIIPYWFAEIEEEEERNPSGTENENTILFIHGRYLINENMSMYGELVVDDFQIDLSYRDSIPDAIGFKVGLDGSRTVFGRDMLFLFEFTTIGTWTYTHWGEFTSWHNSNIPIGYKYGPDCRSWLLAFDYWMNDNWLLSLEHTYLQKGRVNILTPLPPEAERKVDFPSPPVTDHHVIDASFIWHTKLGFIAGGWAGDLHETDNGSVYIKLQLINDISFNL